MYLMSPSLENAGPSSSKMGWLPKVPEVPVVPHLGVPDDVARSNVELQSLSRYRYRYVHYKYISLQV